MLVNEFPCVVRCRSNGPPSTTLVAMRFPAVLFAAAALLAAAVFAQRPGFNYDESKVSPYELPDSLTFNDGKPVRSAADWTNRRRAEVLALFEEHVYGRGPARPQEMHFELLEQDDNALDGKARRKQAAVYFTAGKQGPRMELLLYLPSGMSKPAPVFLAPNFSGNHTIRHDPAIRLSKSWMRAQGAGVVDHRATEASRGTSAGRWAVDKILQRGYGLATVYYGDIDPDFDDGFENGVHALDGSGSPDSWGSLAAWAWGLSRALDYLETDADIDSGRVALMGHSRLGKAALWAGAADERFAIVISNDSGCGGAALSRRRFGETVKRINTSFPHWFNDNFTGYNDNEDALPVDQHMLLALIAPRPLYVASAEEDLWADPNGEFLSAMQAGAIYELLGEKGLGVSERPAVEEPIMNTVGYHVRKGKHDVTEYDWLRYLDFADMHWGRQN